MTGERVRFTALVDALEGGWLLAGYRLEIATNRYRFHVRKLDDALQTTWTKDYNVRLGQLLDAEQVPDSSYLFTGYLLDQGDTSGCLFVLHTDLLGDSLWLREVFPEMDGLPALRLRSCKVVLSWQERLPFPRYLHPIALWCGATNRVIRSGRDRLERPTRNVFMTYFRLKTIACF